MPCRLLSVLFVISSFGISAQAAVTVEKKNAASLNTESKISYFPTPQPAPTNVVGGFVDPGLQSFSLDLGEADESDGNRDNMMVVNVSSSGVTFAPIGSQQLIVVLLVDGEINNQAVKIPIPLAAADRADSGEAAEDLKTCVNQDNCQGTQFIDTSNNNNAINPTSSYLLSARYSSGQLLSLGFYPKDLCDFATEVGVTVDDNICTNLQPTGTSSSTIPITIQFRVANSGSTYLNNSNTTVDSDSHTLSFHARANTQNSCSSNIYFPGDKVIKVEPDAISFSNQSGAAPIRDLLFVGNRGANADPTESGMAGNNRGHDVFDFFEIDDDEPNSENIGTFVNSVTGTPVQYGGAFLLRDAAGIIPDVAASCNITFNQNGVGIQTAAITGFLSQSDCFIATAASRSLHRVMADWLLSTLRGFRDHYLSHNDWGRGFIRWYYAHSPGYAHWIVERPWAQVLIAGLLLPLTAMFWLALFYPYVFVLALAFFSYGAYCFARRLFFKRTKLA